MDKLVELNVPEFAPDKKINGTVLHDDMQIIEDQLNRLAGGEGIAPGEVQLSSSGSDKDAIRFGKDDAGNYGYYKQGESTLSTFGGGGGGTGDYMNRVNPAGEGSFSMNDNVATGYHSFAIGYKNTASGQGAFVEGGGGGVAILDTNELTFNYSTVKDTPTNKVVLDIPASGSGFIVSASTIPSFLFLKQYDQGKKVTSVSYGVWPLSGTVAVTINLESEITISSSTTYAPFLRYSFTGNAAVGDYSHAEGGGNVVSGYQSHVEGNGNKVSSIYSHAEGSINVLNGTGYSHIEGYGNKILFGSNNHAEGESNTIGDALSTLSGSCHVEGCGNLASGSGTHAEGHSNSVYGYSGHVEGNSNRVGYIDNKIDPFGILIEYNADGQNAHAEGRNNIAYGNGSHVEGEGNNTYGFYSHAEGQDTETGALKTVFRDGIEVKMVDYDKGNSAHAEGNLTKAIGQSSHSEGFMTSAIGDSSHAEGSSSQTLGSDSHAEGGYTKAGGTQSHAEGYNSRTGNYDADGKYLNNGEYAHAEGNSTSAISQSSHTEGVSTQVGAYATGAHAEGYKSQAQGSYAHAEGEETKALASNAHSEGKKTQAVAPNAHAEGEETLATSPNAHAEGKGTIATGSEQHVQGRYNMPNPSYSFAIGNGTSNEVRSNCFTVDWSGNTEISGDLRFTLEDGTIMTLRDLAAAIKALQG